MTKLKAHLLNIHFVFTHIEIVLEDTSGERPEFYTMNRWATPSNDWNDRNIWYDYGIPGLLSSFSFEFEADRDDVVQRWRNYWYQTQDERNLLTHNCAVATQWFLREIIGIPDPDLSNYSINHFVFGIFWPSFLTCPVTLPGRIMSNAKFHVHAQQNPKLTLQITNLYLYTQMALSALLFGISAYAFYLSLTLLSTGLALAAAIGGVVSLKYSTQLFFDMCNQVALRDLAQEDENTFQQTKILNI